MSNNKNEFWNTSIENIKNGYVESKEHYKC